MAIKVDAVIFDFDGVLCSDYFYRTLAPELYEKISTDIFQNSKELVHDWMRGKISSKDVNSIIAQKYNIDPEFLQTELEKGARLMKLNVHLLNFTRNIKKQGIKTAIATDNMDVFGKIIVPHNGLCDYFDYIISSYEYGLLKEDEGGRLIDETLNKLGVEYSQALVVDDRSKMEALIKRKGGNFYLYKRGCREKDSREFISWFNRR